MLSSRRNRNAELFRTNCFFCGRVEAAFLGESLETCLGRARCEGCRASSRESHFARLILETLEELDEKQGLRRQAHLLRNRDILCAAASGRIPNTLRAAGARTVIAEFQAHDAPAETRNGVRYENFTQMSFAPMSFDLLLHQDLLEHLGDFEAALCEMHRVLRPGGLMLFQIPLNEYRPTQRRGLLRDGHHQRWLPDVFHDDSLHPGSSLVFTDFGIDIVTHLENAGFCEVQVHQGEKWYEEGDITWLSEPLPNFDDAEPMTVYVDQAQLDTQEAGESFSKPVAFRYNSFVISARRPHHESPPALHSES